MGQVACFYMLGVLQPSRVLFCSLCYAACWGWLGLLCSVACTAVQLSLMLKMTYLITLVKQLLLGMQHTVQMVVKMRVC
jgi:hypothetical protein